MPASCARRGSPRPGSTIRSDAAELAPQRGDVGRRKLAGVVPTDEDGRATVHGAPAFEQRTSGGAGVIAVRGAGHDAVRQIAAEDLAHEFFAAAVAARHHDRDLDDGTEVEVVGAEEAPEPAWMPRHEIGHRPQGSECLGLVPRLAREHLQPQQGLDGQGASRRHGVVEEIPWPHDQSFVVTAGIVETLDRVVPEESQDVVGKPSGVVEPVALERRFVEADERGRHHRVILEVRLELGLPVLPGSEEPPAAVTHPGQDEIGVGRRGRHVVIAPQRGSGLGERAGDQAVPRGQHLVVAGGWHPFLAERIELLARLPGLLGRRLAGEPEEALATLAVPPRAIFVSVFWTMLRAKSLPVRFQKRSTNSQIIGWGNFGAPPRPPSASSNWPEIAWKALNRMSSLRSCTAPRSWPPRFSSAVNFSDDARTSAGRVLQASAMACRSWGNDGSPCRGVGGKYVPP